MSQRITIAHLEAKVEWLNEITGSRRDTYTRPEDGPVHPHAHNYHLSQQYGGVALHRNVEGGGVNNPLPGGHVTKRELAGLLDAFMAGLRAAGDQHVL